MNTRKDNGPSIEQLALADAFLARRGLRRATADETTGFLCRYVRAGTKWFDFWVVSLAA